MTKTKLAVKNSKMSRTRFHVAYLGKSSLDKVTKACQEKTNKTTKELLHLKWNQLSMEANRKEQLQYISENLDARSGNAKLKGIQMKPYLLKWKRQEYRRMWKKLTRKLTLRGYKREMGINKENATELQNNAVKFFTESLFPQMPPMSQVFSDERVKEIKEIQQELVVTKARDLNLTESSAPSEKKSHTIIYVGLGALVIILIIAFVLFMK